MIASPWPDVAGPLEVSIADAPPFFDRNLSVILVEQELESRTVAGWLVFSPEMAHELAASSRWLAAWIAQELDEVFRPWARPDPNPIPELDLFPKTTKLRNLFRFRAPHRDAQNRKSRF